MRWVILKARQLCGTKLQRPQGDRMLEPQALRRRPLDANASAVGQVGSPDSQNPRPAAASVSTRARQRRTSPDDPTGKRVARRRWEADSKRSVAELLALCAQDYKQGQAENASRPPNPHRYAAAYGCGCAQHGGGGNHGTA